MSRKSLLQENFFCSRFVLPRKQILSFVKNLVLWDKTWRRQLRQFWHGLLTDDPFESGQFVDKLALPGGQPTTDLPVSYNLSGYRQSAED